MVAGSISQEQITSFYEAAVLGLQALDSQPGGGRRFGPNADATWTLFKGELGEADRLDLLVRDAAVSHPGAFAPRRVFVLEGLAEDEPYGPEWPGPDAALALRLWRGARAQARSLAEVLEEAARAWSMRPAPLDMATLAAVGPATRILAAGTGAVLALASHFEARPELDLADQVALVTSSPGERQLFGLAVALLGSTRPVRCFLPDVAPELARAMGFPSAGLVLVSDDVPAGARSAVASLASQLSA